MTGRARLYVQALQAWASLDRDQIVRAAHDAGVSKNRIHTITGIARSTIDRILSRRDTPPGDALGHAAQDEMRPGLGD